MIKSKQELFVLNEKLRTICFYIMGLLGILYLLLFKLINQTFILQMLIYGFSILLIFFSFLTLYGGIYLKKVYLLGTFNQKLYSGKEAINGGISVFIVSFLLGIMFLIPFKSQLSLYIFAVILILTIIISAIIEIVLIFKKKKSLKEKIADFMGF